MADIDDDIADLIDGEVELEDGNISGFVGTFLDNSLIREDYFKIDAADLAVDCDENLKMAIDEVGEEFYVKDGEFEISDIIDSLPNLVGGDFSNIRNKLDKNEFDEMLPPIPAGHENAEYSESMLGSKEHGEMKNIDIRKKFGLLAKDSAAEKSVDFDRKRRLAELSGIKKSNKLL